MPPTLPQPKFVDRSFDRLRGAMNIALEILQGGGQSWGAKLYFERPPRWKAPADPTACAQAYWDFDKMTMRIWIRVTVCLTNDLDPAFAMLHELGHVFFNVVGGEDGRDPFPHRPPPPP